MADGTHIAWAEATWNPITGCSVVSPGCTNCYAMQLAGTRLQHHPSRAGLTKQSKAGPVWTGEVRFNEQWIDQPLRWSRPRRVFVCAHGDLFHEGVPDEWIDDVFAVMACARQHTFQVLTKRPARMQAYLTHPDVRDRIDCMLGDFVDRHVDPLARRTDDLRATAPDLVGDDAAWPLPNVWLGTSVEDQGRADQRIPILLDTPAAVRWISAEPLLGLVDISPWLFGGDPPCPVCPRDIDCDCGWQTRRELGQPHLSWVVVGGESGRGARPFNLEWARCMVYQCRAADAPVFMKQLGTNPVVTQRHVCFGEREAPFVTTDRKGTDMAEWPEDLRIQEYPAP